VEAERQAYLRTIEQTFVKLRGRGFMLSPKEVSLVDSWYRAGVPARIIVRALHEGFERRAQRRQAPPGSLAYFESPIEAAVLDWKKRHPNAAFEDAAEEASLHEQVEGAFARMVSSASSPEVAAILETVRDAGRRFDEEESFSALTLRLDGQIVEALAQLLSPEERSRLDESVRETVEQAGRMSAKALAGLRAATAARAIRGHFGVESLLEVME